MITLLDAVRRYSEAHADAHGIAHTPIPGLTMVRATAPSDLLHAIQRPLGDGAKTLEELRACDFMKVPDKQPAAPARSAASDAPSSPPTGSGAPGSAAPGSAEPPGPAAAAPAAPAAGSGSAP